MRPLRMVGHHQGLFDTVVVVWMAMPNVGGQDGIGLSEMNVHTTFKAFRQPSATYRAVRSDVQMNHTLHRAAIRMNGRKERSCCPMRLRTNVLYTTGASRRPTNDILVQNSLRRRSRFFSGLCVMQPFKTNNVKTQIDAEGWRNPPKRSNFSSRHGGKNEFVDLRRWLHRTTP